MKGLDRRDFLKLGLGSVTATALSNSFLDSSLAEGRVDVSKKLTSQYQFFIEPGMTMRLNQERSQIVDFYPWFVSSEFKYLVPDLLSPIVFNQEEVETWLQERIEGFPADAQEKRIKRNPLDSIIQVPIKGSVDVMDIIGEIVLSLSQRRKLNLTLGFLHLFEQERNVLFENKVLNHTSIPIIETPTFLQHNGDILEKNVAVTLYGWKFQFRGPDTHSLGWCVGTNVKHFHVELFRETTPGRFEYVVNFHLGTYKNGGSRCFVLWENTRWRICWKKCAPTRSDLVEMFKAIIIAAAALVGIALAGWVVIAIAEAAAAVIFLPLLLLV